MTKNIESDELYEEVRRAKARGLTKTALFYYLQAQGKGTSWARLNGAWQRWTDEHPEEA